MSPTAVEWSANLPFEGIPAVICGVLTYFALASRPSEAKFLTGEEKRWITLELDQEEQQIRLKNNISPLEALMSRRVWHLASIGFTLNIDMYSLSFWMPQLVKSLSSLYSNTTIGLLVTISYLAGLLAMVLVSGSSDRKMVSRKARSGEIVRSIGRQVCRRAGTGPDECHAWNWISRLFHLRLNSFQEGVHISQTLKRKIESLHLRQQIAKKIVDPERGRRIVFHGNFHLQSWFWQACLLEGTGEGEAHLGIPTGAFKRLANERCACRPKRQVRGQWKNGTPTRFVKGDDSTGANQLAGSMICLGCNI